MTVGINSIECLLPQFDKFFNTKDNNKNIIWESCYSKINFKVKVNEGKDFLTKNNDLLNVMFRGTPCIYIVNFIQHNFLRVNIFTKPQRHKNAFLS